MARHRRIGLEDSVFVHTEDNSLGNQVFIPRSSSVAKTWTTGAPAPVTKFQLAGGLTIADVPGGGLNFALLERTRFSDRS